MDNLNFNEEVQELNTQKEAKKRISVVSRDHVSMVEFVSVVYKNIGYADYHSNKAIAAVHSLSADSIKQQLTSAQKYRLLELKHGTGYKVTDLFRRIILPVNDSEKRAAIIESLKSPDTYQQLFKEYEYHIVPQVTGLKNHFIKNFHLPENIAEKAAQVFIQNLKDYDLLDGRGVLISALQLKPQETHRSDEAKNENAEPVPVVQQTPSPSANHLSVDEGLFELPIPLPGKRRAYLRYPVDSLTRKDITVISKALEFIGSSLEEDEIKKGP